MCILCDWEKNKILCAVCSLAIDDASVCVCVLCGSHLYLFKSGFSTRPSVCLRSPPACLPHRLLAEFSLSIWFDVCLILITVSEQVSRLTWKEDARAQALLCVQQSCLRSHFERVMCLCVWAFLPFNPLQQ